MPGTHRLRANVLLTTCAAIWGFAFVAQVVGAYVGAFTFNATRFALGALSLLPVIAVLDRRAGVTKAQSRARWRESAVPGLICGAFLFGGSSLQQIGLESTTAGNAAFITGLYVVLVPLAMIAFGHRTRRNTWLGAVVALAGLYLLTITSGTFTMKPGDALCLISTVFWAGHILAIGHFSGRRDVLRLSVSQFLANALYSTVCAFVFERRPFLDVPGAMGPILYAGVVSVGIAYTLQVIGQRDAISSHAAIIMSLESMFGAIGGALLLGEQMTPRGYVGAALMLSGIVLSQLPARGESSTTSCEEVSSTMCAEVPTTSCAEVPTTIYEEI